jgi:shikimate dehydrogenase
MDRFDRSVDSEARKITGRTRVVGVIGHPVRHSLSPVIHNAGFRSTGVDYTYVAFDVASGAAVAAVDALRVLDLAGLSVTMPHKADVARCVDRLVESARRLDSVNTVEVESGGGLRGHSTDGDGLVSSLAHSDVDVSGRKISVFGSGGAGRSVIHSLATHGAAEIHVINRTVEAARRAAELADGRAVAHASDDDRAVRDAVATSDIVINATSIGMGARVDGEIESADLPFDPALLAARQTVVDLVYHPIETPLLRAASDRGCRVVDGLGMLVHQAALQQVIWTGERPDVEEMTRVARQALE